MSRANFSKMTESAPAKGTKMKKDLKPIPAGNKGKGLKQLPKTCLLYTSPSPRDRTRSRMPSSA